MIYTASKKTYLLAAAIFLLAFTYSSFFLQGLRLFDNDYNQWITWAREDPLTKTLAQTFNPILAEWNIQFRPVQILVFKVLFPFFGYEASGYYYFKSFLLAFFCVAYFFFLRRYLNNATIAALSALCLTISSSTFTSLYWISDFVILSELLALLVYALFLSLEVRETTPRKPVVLAILAVMFVLTLLCDRTKANGKLIPAVLFLYVILVDWRKLKRYGVLIVLMLLVVVPVKHLISHPTLPFIHEAARAGEVFAWQAASWEKFWLLFAQDFEPFSLRYGAYPPISILAILGFPLVYAALLALIVQLGRFLRRARLKESSLHALWQKRRSAQGKAIVLMSAWALVNIAALASYPSLPRHFQARYAISVLIPLVPLTLWLIYEAVRLLAPSRQRLAAIVIAALVAIQIPFHAHHTYRMRNDFATFMIASDALRDYSARTFRNSLFFYFKLPVFSFRPTHDRNEFFCVFRELNLSDEARTRGVALSDCYVISRFPLKNPYLVLHKSFPGKSNALYDRIFNSGSRQRYRNTMYLYEVRAPSETDTR